jgi:glycosyltransferase involved in cell wall biosynthesis
MMRLFINGLAASAGGGLTYLRNVMPELADRPYVRATVLISPNLRAELSKYSTIDFISAQPPQSAGARFLWEQMRLPALIRSSASDVLISAGNFALRHSPVPQILLSRNSLYTSKEFLNDVKRRGGYSIWMDTLIKGTLARRSIQWSDRTVAPSEAFAAELRAWSGHQVLALHHGFNGESFCADAEPLPSTLQSVLVRTRADRELRLLFVSHYNYYRNFETLFRAIPLLRERLPDTSIKLFLTCKLEDSKNPGPYQTGEAASLARDIGIEGSLVQLGSVPYSLLHRVYRACDVYVSPAYAESFAHPLVEAMASGLPVAASDLAVHREICQGAACYFPPFSEHALAETVAEIVRSSEARQRLLSAAGERWQEFSWRRHVDALLQLAEELAHA